MSFRGENAIFSGFLGSLIISLRTEGTPSDCPKSLTKFDIKKHKMMRKKCVYLGEKKKLTKTNLYPSCQTMSKRDRAKNGIFLRFTWMNLL